MPPRKRARPRPVYFETTIPSLRLCTLCGCVFAAGVAEGIKAEVELVRLDTGQALWCVLNKIQLYCFRRTGLVHMDAMRLSGRHLGDLYPQHLHHVKWPRPVRSDVVPQLPSDTIPF